MEANNGNKCRSEDKDREIEPNTQTRRHQGRMGCDKDNKNL